MTNRTRILPRRSVEAQRSHTRWSAALAAAGAAALALSACGASGEPEDPAGSESQQAPSDGGADPEASDGGGTASDGGGDTASDGGGDQTDQEEGAAAGSDEGRTVFVIPAVEDEVLQQKDGKPMIAADDLAALAQDRADVDGNLPEDAEPASCEKDLLYVASADVRCTITTSFDGGSEAGDFVAHPIATPNGGSGVLFTADEPMTEEARWAAFNGSNEVISLGMGGAYGMDPIPAEQLATDVQTVLDFEAPEGAQYSYENIEGDFTVQSCEGDLDFDRLAPVTCSAVDESTSQQHTVWALPGQFLAEEPGLIVSVDMEPES